MPDFLNALDVALSLILSWDADLMEIVGLSLTVSLAAVGLASILALPLGGVLAITRFPGRMIVIGILNAFMGLPPVVAGLIVYLLLSRAGPFGVWGLLYTPSAMIIVQILVVFPILAALSRQLFEILDEEYADQLRVLGLSAHQKMLTLLHEGRFRLITVLLAGFGRAIAEVGGVMIVGGNIDHLTRVMTTAIALETSKGNLSLALGLGIILLLLAMSINIAAMFIRILANRSGYL
ncbi:MAG: ABC transporter permease [Cohaesibacter sp.]|jgi:tungstate transport system permease protein|nr:ABC transporter permease [Cohaesibacter sp.]